MEGDAVRKIGQVLKGNAHRDHIRELGHVFGRRIQLGLLRSTHGDVCAIGKEPIGHRGHELLVLDRAVGTDRDQDIVGAAVRPRRAVVFAASEHRRKREGAGDHDPLKPDLKSHRCLLSVPVPRGPMV